MEANRGEAELTRVLKIENARIQREKAEKETNKAVVDEGSVPKSSRAGEYKISAPNQGKLRCSDNARSSNGVEIGR